MHFFQPRYALASAFLSAKAGKATTPAPQGFSFSDSSFTNFSSLFLNDQKLIRATNESSGLADSLKVTFQKTSDSETSFWKRYVMQLVGMVGIRGSTAALLNDTRLREWTWNNRNKLAQC